MIAGVDPCLNATGILLEVCQMLSKTLDDLDAADKQILTRDKELAQKDVTIGLQEKRFQALLQILHDFAKVPVEEKKSWWKKTKEAVGKMIDGITDPETIRLILLTIAVIEARK